MTGEWKDGMMDGWKIGRLGGGIQKINEHKPRHEWRGKKVNIDQIEQ